MKKIEEIEQISEPLQSEINIKENENKYLDNSKITNTNVENLDEEKAIKQLTNTKKQKNSKKKVIIISTILITLILLLLSTVFALFNINNNTIISGVSINGIDISGLTKEEASEKVTNIINNKISNSFELFHNDYKTNIIPKQFDASFDIESSINTAYELGRNNNIFKNNFEIISSLFFKVTITPSFSYNEETFNSLILEIENNLPDKLIETSYYIDGTNLVITKGIDGIKINSEILKLILISNINDFYTNNISIDIPVTLCNAKNINIDTIYSEIYKQPKDAYYTKEPFTVYPHVDGIDFGITIDEAKKIIEEEKQNYIIPLKITSPAITTNQIGTEAFPDLLASYSTTYNTRNYNRTTNILLSSAKIDGIVVMPGETFSYNTTVGQRTAAAGYKTAAVYMNGEVTTGIGGGICQVSSTLYNSVLLSNLQIIERYNHAFNTGYVPVGRDATVSWGGPDFKFKNNRNYPIKIYCSNSSGRLTVTIYGLKEENEYEVELQSYVTSYIQYETITKEDPSLDKDQTKVIENGSNGCKSVAYRILKQNGQIISKTLLSKDTYHPHNKIIAVGTKEVINTNVNTNTQTPEPSISEEEKPTNTTVENTITDTPDVSTNTVTNIDSNI